MEYVTLIFIMIFIASFIILNAFNLSSFIVARFSEVDISITEFILWKLQRLDNVRITRGLIIAHKGNLDISKEEILEMEKDKVNSTNVINALLAAKKLGVDFPVSLAIKADKQNFDIIKYLKDSNVDFDKLNSSMDQLKK